MNLKQRIDKDLKNAMLNRDLELVSVLRGLKSAILNVEIENGSRESGLSDDEITAVLQKESKKRQDSIELYKQGGNNERATQELKEKEIIDKYLPAQMSDSELKDVIEDVITKNQWYEMANMGKIIGEVKGALGGAADGGNIAHLVKERLSK